MGNTVYKTIFLSTFAGILIHYPRLITTEKFKDVFRTTKKNLLAVDKDKWITLNNLLNWHMDCEMYLRYIKVFDILSDPSRIICFDTFSFEMDQENSSIVLPEFKGSKLTYGMAVCADGTVLKPYFSKRQTSVVRIQDSSKYYMIQTTSALHEFEIYITKLSTEMKKKTDFPIIVFLNPYKVSIKATTFSSCLKKGIILVGCYPNSFKNFNPMEMAIYNNLRQEIVEATSESRHSFASLNTLNDAILNIAMSDMKKVKIKESFIKMGIYPWSAAGIDYHSFRQCTIFKTNLEKVVYRSDKYM